MIPVLFACVFLSTYPQVRKQGYREGSKGQGAKSELTSDDWEMSIKHLKGSGWEFGLTENEEKKLSIADKTGKLPAKLEGKLESALVVTGRLELTMFL